MRKVFFLAAVAQVVAVLVVLTSGPGGQVAANPGDVYGDSAVVNSGEVSGAIGNVTGAPDGTFIQIGTVASSGAGVVTVSFDDNIAFDGPGDDIEIHIIDALFAATATIEVSADDGITFVSAGNFADTANILIDLGSLGTPLAFANAVRFTQFSGPLPGFDLDAVEALDSTELVVDDNLTECADAAYTTIQAAINAASADDTIAVCPGTYNTEDLSITANGLELFGAGSASTTIEGVDTVPAASFPLADPNIDIKANGVSIHGFTIQHPVVAGGPTYPDDYEYASGIVLTGTDIEIYDNDFLVGTGDVSQGIQTWSAVNQPAGLGDISGLHIHDNTFSHLAPPTGVGAYEAIYINPQSDSFDATVPANAVTIEDNTFSGGLIRAVTTERSGTVVEGNTLSTDISVTLFGSFPRGIQLSAGDHHLVTDNIIDDSGSGMFVTGILVIDGVTASTIGGTGNTVNGSSADGIKVSGDNNNILNNGAGHNGANGILLTSEASGNTLTHNTAYHNTLDGIHVDGDPNGLYGNNAHHNGEYGIYYYGSGDCPITGPHRNKAKFNGDEDIAGC